MCISTSLPIIENCTITGNSAFASGGGISIQHGSPTIINTIVEGNTGNGGIWFYGITNATITYCDFHNNDSGSFTGNVPDSIGLITTTNLYGDSCDTYFNIYMDPLFENPVAGDFHLQAGSPCIDAGDPNSPLDPDSTIADIGTFFYDQSSVNNPREIPDLTEFRLFQNYPNPFNPITIIPFQIQYTTHVSLRIYNILGQRVTTLIDSRLTLGHHTVIFDATDMPSGIYFSTLSTPTQTITCKMLMLK